MTAQIINQKGQVIDDHTQGLDRVLWDKDTFDSNASQDNLLSSWLIINGHDDLDAIISNLQSVQHIAIHFPNFADGRGFSMARALRDHGFKGHLRAEGHVMPDQFHHAMAVGFDDIAVPLDLAARYGEQAWQDVAANKPLDYQSRLNPIQA